MNGSCMEELKIRDANGELIIRSWKESNFLALTIFTDDDEYNIRMDIDIDQATQLRDWLTGMIEKQGK